MTNNSYRDRIYQNYASKFQNTGPEFDMSASLRWGRAYTFYLRGWLPENKGAAVLDAACGGGRLLHFYKEAGLSQISGVDVSPEQIRLARQITQNVFEENVLTHLRNNPGRFDLISGFDIIEHLTKQEVLDFLDAAYAALRPNGRLILQTPNADSLAGMSIRYGDFTHEVCFNAQSLSRLMKLVGFNTIEARETGPILWGYSMASTARWLVWSCLRALTQLFNYAEVGSPGSGITTRVFLITGLKG